MITRGADDATAMMFNASLPDGKAAVFKDALAGKQLMAPPAPVTRHLKEKGEEIIEITEFEAGKYRSFKPAAPAAKYCAYGSRRIQNLSGAKHPLYAV